MAPEWQVVKENESSPRHDISVRRVQGTSWSFQAFYSNFREEISGQLGMSDYTQLSLYSPMVQKRKPLNQRASSWCVRAVLGTPALALPLSRPGTLAHEGTARARAHAHALTRSGWVLPRAVQVQLLPH